MFLFTTKCQFLLWLLLLLSAPVSASQTFSGRIETAIVIADSLPSWQDKGLGLTRYSNTQVVLQQAFLQANYAINKDWRFLGVANAYSDGDKHFGITQAFMHYKPLSASYVKFSSKLGFFYPAMSIENVDAGWLSPYTYTQSAINSWVGEELRVAGAELTWSANGRKRRSPWSWRFNIAAFKANDPVGSLLTWRGFALHNRQSLHNDRVQFAALPSVSDPTTFNSPTYLEPFTEIDGNWGAYLGIHLNYLRKANLRYYYYDNRANPEAINAQNLYAWHTKFHHLALQYQISNQWRLLSQVMYGDTLMGIRAVYAEYMTWFIGLSYTNNHHKLVIRYDQHKVSEDDLMPQDPNSSNGKAITLAWTWHFSPKMELGIEWHYHKSEAANRALLNYQTKQTQSQLMTVFAYNF